MNTFLKIVITGCIAVSGLFFMSHKAQAGELFRTDLGSEISQNEAQVFYSSTSTLGTNFSASSSRVSKIRVYLKTTEDDHVNHPTYYVGMTIKDENSVSFGSTNKAYAGDISFSSFQAFDFEFSATSTVDFGAGKRLSYVAVDQGNLTEFQVAAHSPNKLENSGLFSGATFLERDYSMVIYDQFTGIAFSDPAPNSVYKSEDTIVFSGFCPVSGDNQVAITYDATNIGHATLDGSPNSHGDVTGTYDPDYVTSAIFNIPCTDNQWTAELPALLGVYNPVIVMEKADSTFAEMFITTTLYGTSPSQVNFSVPFIDNITTPDFSDWYVEANIFGNSNATSVKVQILYGTTTAPNLYLDNSEWFALQNTTTSLHLNFEVVKSNDLSQGSYVAEAALVDNNLYTIATSSLLHFTIASGTKVSNGANGYTPSQWNAQNNAVEGTAPLVNCSDENVVVRGMCNVFVTLFIPSQDDFSQFGGLWDKVKRKPPFGYFQMSVDSLTSVNASSTMATSTPSALLGFSFLSLFLTPVDYALAFLAMIGFLFWIFYRIKHFQF